MVILGNVLGVIWGHISNQIYGAVDRVQFYDLNVDLMCVMKGLLSTIPEL